MVINVENLWTSMAIYYVFTLTKIMETYGTMSNTENYKTLIYYGKKLWYYTKIYEIRLLQVYFVRNLLHYIYPQNLDFKLI